MPVLSPEQELFADTVTRVAEERIAPIGARMEEDNQFPHDLIDLYRELGWLSLMTPEKYGGGRAGPRATVGSARENSRGCAPRSPGIPNARSAIPRPDLGPEQLRDPPSA